MPPQCTRAHGCLLFPRLGGKRAATRRDGPAPSGTRSGSLAGPRAIQAASQGQGSGRPASGHRQGSQRAPPHGSQQRSDRRAGAGPGSQEALSPPSLAEEAVAATATATVTATAVQLDPGEGGLRGSDREGGAVSGPAAAWATADGREAGAAAAGWAGWAGWAGAATMAGADAAAEAGAVACSPSLHPNSPPSSPRPASQVARGPGGQAGDGREPEQCGLFH
jgi:hypothetical protein